MLRSIATAALLLAASANAHFYVDYPKLVGKTLDSSEDDAQCGGYSPNIDDIETVDFHVGGDSIATRSTHTQTNWLYRITTEAISKNNWTQVYPIVQQSGPGAYCTNTLTIPDEYIGQKAILGIVASGIDGVLYQCAAVHFVKGSAETPSQCVNGSGITASFSEDDTLSGLVSSSTVSGGGSDSSDEGEGGSDAPEPTTTPNAAPSLHAPTAGVFGAFLTTGAMMLAGFAFMI